MVRGELSKRMLSAPGGGASCYGGSGNDEVMKKRGDRKGGRFGNGGAKWRVLLVGRQH